MVKELVIHLGGHKTGSTSIQNAFARGIVSSGTKSFLYPATGPGEVLAKTRGNHGALAVTLMPRADAKQRFERFRQLSQRLRRSGADIAVISAERLEYADPEILRAAMAANLPKLGAAARIIVYVRPHAERLVSGYAEQIKQGIFHGSLEELHARTSDRARERNFHYYERFARWREVFGDRFELRPMIRDRLHNRDAVQDFLHWALRGEEFSVSEPSERNVSLPLQDLALLREMHRVAGQVAGGGKKGPGKPAPARVGLALRLGRRLGAAPLASPTKLALHRSLAEEVVETYRADAEALDAAFCDGTPMTDALLAAPGKAVDAPQSIEAADHFGDAELRLIRAWSEAVAEGWSAAAQDGAAAELDGSDG